jgi:hypothetical protein
MKYEHKSFAWVVNIQPHDISVVKIGERERLVSKLGGLEA